MPLLPSIQTPYKGRWSSTALTKQSTCINTQATQNPVGHRDDGCNTPRTAVNVPFPRRLQEKLGNSEETNASTEPMVRPALALLGEVLFRFLLVIAASNLLLTSCESTGDPNQGGLIGWSQGQANQRIAAREQHLADHERATAYKKARTHAFEIAAGGGVAGLSKQQPSVEDTPANRVPDPKELKKDANIIGQPGLENSAAKRVPDPMELKKDAF